MNTNLSGKTVFITGAASGIGRATAEAFAGEGAKLGLLDRDAEALSSLSKELSESGAVVHYEVADLSTGPGVANSIKGLLDKSEGIVDVLINNVGTCFARTFDELDDEAWVTTFNINFMSAVRSIRAVLPTMRSRHSGVILTTSSDLARQPEANLVDYEMSKVSLVSLTKSLALSEGPHIRVNTVAPGPIWTPLWTQPGGLADTLGEVHKLPAKEAVEYELSMRQLPLGRLGKPEEVANVFVFLASDAAQFVTGSVWGIDGGSVRGLL